MEVVIKASKKSLLQLAVVIILILSLGVSIYFLVAEEWAVLVGGALLLIGLRTLVVLLTLMFQKPPLAVGSMGLKYKQRFIGWEAIDHHRRDTKKGHTLLYLAFKPSVAEKGQSIPVDGLEVDKDTLIDFVVTLIYANTEERDSIIKNFRHHNVPNYIQKQ